MARVLVIGAGLSGCTVAYALAERGIDIILVEKTSSIGGRAYTYGCKAAGRCLNCGVCLTKGLWDKVLSHKNIRVLTDTVVKVITGDVSNFSAKAVDKNGSHTFNKINAVVVSTGFESGPGGLSAHLHIDGTSGLMTGTQLEELMLSRTQTGLFENVPKSVAFIQCLGSRDKNEGGLYCSRVCCSYSTRAAKVIRSYYPECEIVFFYMEMQNVEAGNYFDELQKLDMEFIKCRPLKVTGAETVLVEYVDSAGGIDSTGGIKSRAFDLAVLSDGIHASLDNDKIAELCRLRQDEDGFLHTACSDSGIYVAGCARAPMKIDEAYADSIAVAGKILVSILKTDTDTEQMLNRR